MRRAGFMLLISCIIISVTGHLGGGGVRQRVSSWRLSSRQWANSGMRRVGSNCPSAWPLSMPRGSIWASTGWVPGWRIHSARHYSQRCASDGGLPAGSPSASCSAAAGLLMPTAVRWAEATRTRFRPSRDLTGYSSATLRIMRVQGFADGGGWLERWPVQARSKSRSVSILRGLVLSRCCPP